MASSSGASSAEQIALGISAALASFGLFVFLSSAVTAVLFGPNRGPRFIRSAAYLYSRPTSGLEWFGLAIAALIALSTQVVALVMASSYEKAFGMVGTILMYLELPAAGTWLLYLVWLYRRPARRP